MCFHRNQRGCIISIVSQRLHAADRSILARRARCLLRTNFSLDLDKRIDRLLPRVCIGRED